MTGAQKSAATRRASAEEGRAFAHAWSARRRPVAMTAPYPIRDARRCSEWSEA